MMMITFRFDGGGACVVGVEDFLECIDLQWHNISHDSEVLVTNKFFMIGSR